MKILLTGISGYVGGILKNELIAKYSLLGVNRTTIVSDNVLCDLSDYESVKKLKVHDPDVVIHAAGNKDIQYCENNPDSAYKNNTQPLTNLIRVFGGKSRIIYLSTDYVFAGDRGYYAELDKPDPLTEYGRSKYKAEVECLKSGIDDFFILRLSALYDKNATFPRYVFDSIKQGRIVECYSDIFYSPTYFKDFSVLIKMIIESDNLENKILHSCGERTSRYEFARKLCVSCGYDEELIVSKNLGENSYFLFHDLSLKNDVTEKELGVKKSDLDNILGGLLLA